MNAVNTGPEQPICFAGSELRAKHHIYRFKEDFAYDISKFTRDVIMQVPRTHPMMIVGGIVEENAFLFPPEQFLRAMCERSPGRSGATDT